MFESSHPFAFFDYVRVPYTVEETAAAEDLPTGIGVLRGADRAAAGGRVLLWSRSGPGRSPRSSRVGRFRLDGFTMAGHLRRGDPVAALKFHGSGWRPAEPILDGKGRRIASVWRDTKGSVFLPFDPGEVMHVLWSERYTSLGARAAATRLARTAAVRGYYAVRPLLPRGTQLRMRRAFARSQDPAESFPAWPVEHSLHDMYDWLLATVAGVAGEPVPWIAPWPDGKEWAMVLSHDVETQAGVDDMELLRADERSRGYRSGWNFVPERYDVTDAVRSAVTGDGCEVGVHGLRHDGRDLASRHLLEQRLPEIRRHADAWGAVGFRSPATQRAWELMPLLGFDYDSSYTDTDPYEPQPGGCCSYLPFFVEDTVELPITLPQDHTLFEILQQRTGRTWVDKAHEIRRRGGLVLVLSHPDYARNPHAAAAWRELLGEFEHDPTRWQPLPREAASWWRERAASDLHREGDGWVVSGPAAERASVRLTGAPEPAPAQGR